MKYFWKIVISCLIFRNIFAEEYELHGKVLSNPKHELYEYELYSSLPESLAIGAGSSAYQVEGAWNIGGKSESTFDNYLHTHPGVMPDGANGDIAGNSYFKYKEDVQRMKSIGLDFYRFSVSWPRILPTGFTNVINQEGLQYYKNLTAELVANGIEPIVTLYHWDHPQILEEYGGWTNELMADWFASYARVVIRELGDYVKIWTTVNEPRAYCRNAYAQDIAQLAPGKKLTNVGLYLCVHNILKAHARVYRMYDSEYRATQQGQIGIVTECDGFLSANFSDAESIETAFQFICGWINHPIFKGDYPDVMKKRMAMISKAEGYEKSRLPEFSEEWISYIKGTSDYFGLNHYSSVIVSPDPNEKLGVYYSDMGLILQSDPSWPRSSTITWLTVYPPGLGIALRKIRDEYNNPPLRVMESGFADSGELEDYDRIRYFHDYLEELLIAVNRDGCNVVGYSMWSMIDSYEWATGYRSPSGIISVNYSDPDRKRTAKWSSYWWTEVLRTRKLQPVPTKS